MTERRFKIITGTVRNVLKVVSPFDKKNRNEKNTTVEKKGIGGASMPVDLYKGKTVVRRQKRRKGEKPKSGE